MVRRRCREALTADTGSIPPPLLPAACWEVLQGSTLPVFDTASKPYQLGGRRVVLSLLRCRTSADIDRPPIINCSSSPAVIIRIHLPNALARLSHCVTAFSVDSVSVSEDSVFFCFFFLGGGGNRGSGNHNCRGVRLCLV